LHHGRAFGTTGPDRYVYFHLPGLNPQAGFFI
jgi:hypothetical protein